MKISQIAWVGIPTAPAWLPTDMLIKVLLTVYFHGCFIMLAKGCQQVRYLINLCGIELGLGSSSSKSIKPNLILNHVSFGWTQAHIALPG